MSRKGGLWQLFVMDANGKNAVQLTTDRADHWAPSWSPDGRQIAFQALRGTIADLYIMDANDSNRVKLITDRAGSGGVAWQPSSLLILLSDMAIKDNERHMGDDWAAESHVD